MRYLLTTDEGIEDIAAEEVREWRPDADARAAPYGFGGHVLVDVDPTNDWSDLSTVHHVVEVRGEGGATSLEEIQRTLAEVEFPELAHAASFRVTSEKLGDHGLARMDIQRAAGAVIQQRYGTAVDLEGYEVQVRVDLYGHHLVAGIQRTDRSLSKRIKRARALRTSLKPTIAAAMLRLAGAHRGDGRLIDPLCGTGTIPIEAKRLNPGLAVHACDWDAETVDTARATVANHGLDIDVRPGDARSLHSLYAERFDYIVTDPPYGIRVGKRADIGALYGELLREFEASLTATGRLVLIVVKFRAFLRGLAPTGLRIVHERLIAAGGLHPRIFVLERRPPSTPRRSSPTR